MGGSTRKFSSVHDNIGFGKKWLEIGYNPKDIWSNSRIHAQDPERENHPTQKPLEIIERMVKASCPKNGTVFDPFMGTGTTAIACLKNDRQYAGFEINKNYYKIIMNGIKKHNNRPTLFQKQEKLGEIAGVLQSYAPST